MADLQEVEFLAKSLMRKHNLDDWTFKFDNAKRRVGACHYAPKTITLSKPLAELNDMELMEDTILHEIAHAITGKGVNHSVVWQHTAKSIGCSAERCCPEDIVRPKGKYAYECPNCGFKWYFHRKFKWAKACPKCCNKYNNGKYTEKYKFVKVED